MSIPKTHPFAFDPTYGMRLEELLAIEPPEEPAGFDAFWEARYLKALDVDPQPMLSVSKLSHPDWHVRDLVYVSTDAFKIGGWLLLPRQGLVKRGLVVGHGYGGRDQPDLNLPVEETAVIFPCCRGLSLSRHPPISENPSWHVLHDIDKRDAYIIGGCVEDIWLAVSTLVTLYPWLSGNIGYSGISFGGGVGAMAIAYDERIDRGHLALPSFGHQPLRLKLPSVGSAQSVQEYQADHGNVLETLRFYDAATAARRIDVPMLTAVALFDPSVAPPCQFAVANAIRKYNEIFILDAGHFDYTGSAEEEAVLRDKIGQFFRVP
ncbi:acetylxylan esterase [Rhizobium lentis]|uniref:Acetylxylan esterase n=1 Tax=Rhizobium lentis TaxID=1138194 RepID=A0A9Q3M7B5_9HYPH|nr:acetylxylan esterase [Rhizobium lentis]MBX4957222.1 acetylxylan esterase [Rhizobium lentis]MBX4975202.1 acetylxylan esterase [Rhizobium lentis]MBX4987212.1 acetylxylan esterase [Rhizobium lentis]MBX5001762.1 acetylxylan esterase [Rhizobium lentis]MBX5005656.1 acetylxylan esterase [Rhizobium lentis]